MLLLFALSTASAAPSTVTSTRNTKAAASAPARAFAFYDATLYANKPDLSPHGFRPITVLYAHQLYWPSENYPKPEPPSDEALAHVAKRWIGEGEQLVVVDLEHWPPTGSQATIARTVDNYRRVLRALRSARPDITLGLYGVLPIFDFHRALKGEDSAAYLAWKSENDALQALAAEVDVVFPSLYTVERDPDRWVQFARANISEARRYGKPVYPFLWPQYHDEARPWLRLRFIEPDFWRLQLETARKYADGAVIWGGWDKTRPAEWDNNAPWFEIARNPGTAPVQQGIK